MSVLGTREEESFRAGVSLARGVGSNPLQCAGHWWVCPRLSVTLLRGVMHLARGDSPRRPDPMRFPSGFRCRCPILLVRGYKPVSLSGFTVVLALRSDSPTADDALLWGPGPFGGTDSHGSRLLLLPGFAPRVGGPVVTNRLQPGPRAPLPDRGLSRPRRAVSARDLSPDHFGGPASRRMNCYVLLGR